MTIGCHDEDKDDKAQAHPERAPEWALLPALATAAAQLLTWHLAGGLPAWATDVSIESQGHADNKMTWSVASAL